MVPVASNGIIKFDGKGECSATDFVKSPGSTRGPRESILCNYSGTRDGCGAVRISSQVTQLQNRLIFVIVDHVESLQFIVDQPSAVVSFGSMKKQ